MSEVNPTQLNKRIRYGVRAANVIPTPIDRTLTHQGEAADAKATGDAIAGVLNGATINGKLFTNKTMDLYAVDIKLSNEPGADTIAKKLEDLSGMNANDVVYDEDNMVSVKDAIDDVKDTINTDFTQEEVDEILEEIFNETEEEEET